MSTRMYHWKGMVCASSPFQCIANDRYKPYASKGTEVESQVSARNKSTRIIMPLFPTSFPQAYLCSIAQR